MAHILSYQGARQLFNREDTDGDMIMCYRLLQMYWRQNGGRKHEKPTIQFVKAGEKVPASASIQRGLLSRVSTWEMRVDLNKRLVFPDVVHTNLRPYIVLWSEKEKDILMELTVPREEGCGEAHERNI